jgi:hypothetical protein
MTGRAITSQTGTGDHTHVSYHMSAYTDSINCNPNNSHPPIRPVHPSQRVSRMILMGIGKLFAASLLGLVLAWLKPTVTPLYVQIMTLIYIDLQPGSLP